jgi:hypothetical protein
MDANNAILISSVGQPYYLMLLSFNVVERNRWIVTSIGNWNPLVEIKHGLVGGISNREQYC